MGEFIVYTLKAAVMLTLLFSVYKLTTGRLKCASLQRAALIAIYPISLLTPFLKPEWFRHTAPLAFQNIDLSDVRAYQYDESFMTFQPSLLADISVTVMIAGSAIVAAISLLGLAWIAKCNLSGRKTYIGALPVTIVSNHAISPFSFGGRIFLSENDFAESNAMIIAHETSHVRHRHYLDLLIGRVVAVMQWWNPVAWLMLREIHDVHEYQADNDVITQGYDRREYQYLLLRKAMGTKLQFMTDNFNHSRLKGRLTMINRKNSSRRSRLAFYLCIPVAIAGIMTISSDSFAYFAKPLYLAFESGYSSTIPDNPPVSSSVLNEEERSDEIESPEVLSVVTSKKEKRISSERNTIRMQDKAGSSYLPASTDNPDVIVNGEEYAYSKLDKIDTSTIKDISVYKNNPNHPNGLIIINLKDPE